MYVIPVSKPPRNVFANGKMFVSGFVACTRVKRVALKISAIHRLKDFSRFRKMYPRNTSSSESATIIKVPALNNNDEISNVISIQSNAFNKYIVRVPAQMRKVPRHNPTAELRIKSLSMKPALVNDFLSITVVNRYTINTAITKFTANHASVEEMKKPAPIDAAR